MGGGAFGGGGDDDYNEGGDAHSQATFGWKGWRDRVAADQQFPYKVFIEQVRPSPAKALVRILLALCHVPVLEGFHERDMLELMHM